VPLRTDTLTGVDIRYRLTSMNGKERQPICCAVCEIDESSSEDRLETAALFKALGDPTRYEIFRLITAQPESICVCHITDRFDVSQPTISHHLKVLREAGLITVSRQGVWAYYAADLRGIERLRGAVGQLTPSELVGAA
jgi:ArsR family transcriptional regulator, arsenate/arsenite/antimonite-responsive transcriptional repressor